MVRLSPLFIKSFKKPLIITIDFDDNGCETVLGDILNCGNTKASGTNSRAYSRITAHKIHYRCYARFSVGFHKPLCEHIKFDKYKLLYYN